MKTLIITAHPKKDAFSHAIATTYATSANLSGKHTQIINLYQDENQQDYLTFSDMKQLPQDEKRNTMQALIREADELVFIYPLWWGSMPAILKNFIDTNFTAGFAYRYERHSHLPKWLDIKPTPLLKGKKARIFFTCDAPSWTQAVVSLPHLFTWYISILNFCGIQLSSVRSFTAMRKSTPEIRAKWLNLVAKIAKKK